MKRPYSPGRLRVRFGVTRVLIQVMSAYGTKRKLLHRQFVTSMKEMEPAARPKHMPFNARQYSSWR